MTLRELNEMCEQYGLSPDRELWVRPLLKDKPRKVSTLDLEEGRIIFRCNVEKKRKNIRNH